MGKIYRKFAFRGIDTRTNHLYREEGTAYDARNVQLDSNRNLIKRPDFDELVLLRGTDGELGLFENKLPFDAVVIDIMQYDDYIVVGVECDEAGHTVNKFYKFFEENYIPFPSIALQFIPFQKEVYISAVNGQIVNKGTSDISGKFTKTNQENILFFMGGYCTNDVGSPFLAPSATFDKDNNLSPLLTFDGKVISTAGTPSPLDDTTLDIGTQTIDTYVRTLPMKIDALGRHVFGNYSTHLAENDGLSVGRQILDIPVSQFVDRSYDYQVFFKTALDISLNASDDEATRTKTVDIFSRSLEYKSIGKGQYVYGITANTIFTPFTPPITSADTSYSFYRCTIEDVDYDLSTVTLNEFKFYNTASGLWEDSDTFEHSIDVSPFLSNIILVLYTSDDFTFGYKFAGYTMHAYDGSTDMSYGLMYSTKDASTLTSIFYQPELLYISEDFEDVYDEESVKLPAPKGRQVIDYLGANLIVDQTKLYFSDFSVGGNIETFTPFDNFIVGSTKRGNITGVFANETFITVFREEEAYYITGNIFLLNYRVQSTQSTRIGCSDPKSIIDFAGAGLFLSPRGIYMCQQGGVLPEISDSIETLFTDNALDLQLDTSNCSSVVDFNKEQIYFHIASNNNSDGYILVYNYYHKEWLIWEGMNAVGGFDIFNNDLFYSDGTNIYRQLSTNVDADAYYMSNFETIESPSFLKKFLQVLIYTIRTSTNSALTIKTFRDWDSVNASTEETKAITAGQVDLTQRFNPARSKSVAIQINCYRGDELNLDGYEYEFADDVGMFKSDD